MSNEVTSFDLSTFLDSDEAICEYLTQVLDEGDMEEAKRALGYVAKARGMTSISEQTGLGRESLYKTLKPETKPRFDTVLRILHATGMRLKVEPMNHQ